VPDLHQIRGANLPLLLQYRLISAAASAFRYTVITRERRYSLQLVKHRRFGTTSRSHLQGSSVQEESQGAKGRYFLFLFWVCFLIITPSAFSFFLSLLFPPPPPVSLMFCAFIPCLLFHLLWISRQGQSSEATEEPDPCP
jgi:hypothetical protein